MDVTFGRLEETEMATRLETAIARVIKEGKVRTYIWAARPQRLMSLKRLPTTRVNDMSAIGRTRRGEGGKDSTLDVAKAIADSASS